MDSFLLSTVVILIVMKKFGWCYIGAGAIARETAKELVKTEDCRIVSVWNRTHSKAVEFAKDFHAKAYENVLDAINDPEVEGVYIALTNDKHFEYTKLCLKHHKPVLCEKPFTMNEKEAIEIFELAKKENVYVTEAMWTWFNKPAYKVKSWVKEEKVGKIKNVLITFGFPALLVKRIKNRVINPNLLGGVLLDMGVYGIRYSLELFGNPHKIECEARLKYGVDLYEKVNFIYDGFTVTHKFAVDRLVGEKCVIKGNKGKIKVPFFHMAKIAKLRGQYRDTYRYDALLYGTQFSTVANEIRDGLLTSQYVTKENTIKCMKLMDDIRKKMNLVYPQEK
ncbi:MAG: Gfo/Idh/MocA family oxidoreductase [Bacilli bacterium]|nr:Gfo/Idh/MocA family oxidoreductase [Bacilli bacterium]